MAAEINFHPGSEPPQIKTAFVLHQEGGFRLVHLPPDVLQPAIVRPGGEQAHNRGIPGKGTVGKGIDEEIGDGHWFKSHGDEEDW